MRSTPEQKVCPQADRFAAAVLMPPESFAAYARASGLDVVALHRVFRCAYAAVALRLTEVLRSQPLLAVLYERREQSDPAIWTAPSKLGDLRITVVKRTAGMGAPRSPLLSGWRGGSPRKGKALSAGSLAESAAHSGMFQYDEENGIAVIARPVFWKGRLAKVAVVAVPWEQRQTLEPQSGWRGRGYSKHGPRTVSGHALG